MFAERHEVDGAETPRIESGETLPEELRIGDSLPGERKGLPPVIRNIGKMLLDGPRRLQPD